MPRRLVYPFPAGREGVFHQLIRETVAAGGILIFPTETFYALGGSAREGKTVAAVFRLKARTRQLPVPLLITDQKMLTDLVEEIPPAAGSLMARFWPGPLTLVFQARPGLPAGVVSSQGKVAVRISSHPLLRTLAATLRVPLVATSANRHGEPPAAAFAAVNPQLAAAADVIIDGGPCPGGRPSTIVDVTTSPPQLLRDGQIPSCRLFPAGNAAGKDREL